MRSKTVRLLIIPLLFCAMFVGAAPPTFAQGTPGPVPALVNGGRLDRRLGGYISVTLTDTQIRVGLCSAAGIQIIPAFGANTVVTILGGILSYTYGTSPYTNVSGHNLKLFQTNQSSGNALTPTMTMLGFLDQSANEILSFEGTPSDELLSTNGPVVLQQVGSSCYTGGSATNSLTIRVNFVVHNR